VERRANLEGAQDGGFGDQQIFEAGMHDVAGKVEARQLDEDVLVPLLGCGDGAIEVGEIRIADRLGDQPKALAASGLDDPADEESVEKVLLPPPADQITQSAHIAVLGIASQHTATPIDQPVDLVEVLELFAGDIHHRDHQLPAIGIVRDERNGDRRGLPLRGRVIEQEAVEVFQDGIQPFGRGFLFELQHLDPVGGSGCRRIAFAKAGQPSHSTELERGSGAVRRYDEGKVKRDTRGEIERADSRMKRAARPAYRPGIAAAGRLALLIAFVGLLPAGAAEPAAPPPLRFTAIPDQDETRLLEKFEPVARYLSSRLGVSVEYVPVTRYSDSVDLFKNGDIQLAWFGGLTGVQARHAVPGARAIAQGVEDPDFYSYFIANADTGLERSEDFPMALEGRRFSFGSMGSTSGRLMPEHFIRENAGESPSEFFASVGFSGSHDQTAELVESGQVEAGALNYKVFDRRIAEGLTDPARVRIIWVTPTYPDYNFTAHPMLEDRYGAGFTDRLAMALVSMDDPNLLSAFPRKALIPARDSDFEAIRELAVELDFIR